MCVKCRPRLDCADFCFCRNRCTETYPAQNELELDLKVGDIIFVSKKRDDGWYKGTLQRTGKTGLFPGSFVVKH
ncbi:hypothetical protein DPMN_060766 [Dreissena polymorpha]|uniref:SH3 domain-containing protein n=1 Tax=Dreissena polymorpha TaxID=45954 RepID=A0A9D4C6E9_DREPO|nr:hypothetical protein DPMN_060766 [Dreissena polymorpha]